MRHNIRNCEDKNLLLKSREELVDLRIKWLKQLRKTNLARVIICKSYLAHHYEDVFSIFCGNLNKHKLSKQSGVYMN